MGKPRSKAQAQGVTLDAGALIALERGDHRMIALLQLMQRSKGRFHVPAGALAQAFRDGARQAVLSRFIRSQQVEIEALDEHVARACGELCGAAGTADVVDASVVLCARKYRDVIVTSDAGDLRQLDSKVPLERV